MGVHNITTPAGFSGDGGSFDFNPGFGQDWSDRFNRAQRVIDNEVLRYNDPYVPFDRGILRDSGEINTVAGSGEVVYRTPYAARLYYNPQYNFQGAPMRGAYSFERMKADHKEDILRSAGKELGK